jgi:porin
MKKIVSLSNVLAGALVLPSLVLAALPAVADEVAPEVEKGFWDREKLTGDWGGIRTDLADRGVELTATYTAETLGNPSGGIKRRAVGAALLQGDLDVNLDKLVGWQGGKIHATAFHIQGRQLTSNFIGGLIPVSSVEAAPSTRLFSLWFEQSVLDDRASLRFGQVPMQEEFFTSTYAAYMVNSAFGWPAIYAANMPSGGGGYPLANMGTRLKVKPTEEISLMAAVFSGNVAPGTNVGNDAQKRNRSGTDFSFDSPPVWFGEAAYSINQDKDSPGLPATFKLGGWYYNGRTADQHFDNTGLSLGSGASSGVARNLHGNWAVYGIVDHMLWKREGTVDSGVGAFFRTTYMPDDRNQMSYWLDTGLTLKGTFEGRDDDITGISFAYGKMSDELASRDADARRFGTATAPDHDFESVVEIMYSYAVTPWWSVTGFGQYLFHPGGTTTLPENTSKTIPDASVLGLRTSFKL